MSKRTPGVYIEEISKFPPSVAQVETAIPAFIGYTENTTYQGESLVNKPRRIKSLAEYTEIFGGPPEEAFSATVTTSTDANGKVTITSLSITDPGTLGNFKMYPSLQMYFDNGGGACYIVCTGGYTSISDSDLTTGLAALEKEDEPTILVFPDALDTNEGQVYDQALKQCAKLQDRFLVADVASTGVSNTDATNFRNLSLSSSDLKYGAAYYPPLKTLLEYGYDETAVNVTIDGGGAVTLDTLETSSNDIYNKVKEEIAKKNMVLPPSGAIAGIYALVDNSRGVWKAPANVSLSSVVEPTVIIDDDDQESLNVDTTAGKSINAIRRFRGRGVMVWGARTLAGNDNEWRYVSVRRYFNMVEESVKKASGQFVFEPNDANTWAKVRGMINNFLTIQWRQRALAGATPEEAFYVKIGLGETMTPLDILEGRMNVEIGMAVVRPAEFIILKFSHKMQES